MLKTIEKLYLNVSLLSNSAFDQQRCFLQGCAHFLGMVEGNSYGGQKLI